MTRKKCIKILMDAAHCPKPRPAEKLFLQARKQLESIAPEEQFSNEDVLINTIAEIERIERKYNHFLASLHAMLWKHQLIDKAVEKHDRLMGGPRENITQ